MSKEQLAAWANIPATCGVDGCLVDITVGVESIRDVVSQVIPGDIFGAVT